MDSDDQNIGEHYFQTGKKYDLSQSASPSNGTLARASFQQGAYMGHTGCIRALAEVMYYGVGGAKEPLEAIRLLWIAYLKGDRFALDELADMFEDFAGNELANVETDLLISAAQDSREIARLVRRVEQFLNQFHNRTDGENLL